MQRCWIDACKVFGSKLLTINSKIGYFNVAIKALKSLKANEGTNYLLAGGTVYAKKLIMVYKMHL